MNTKMSIPTQSLELARHAAAPTSTRVQGRTVSADWQGVARVATRTFRGIDLQIHDRTSTA